MLNNLNNSLKEAAVFAFIRFLMTMGWAMGILINPETSQVHTTTDSQKNHTEGTYTTR